MKQSGLILALVVATSAAYAAETKNTAPVSAKSASAAQPVLAAATVPAPQGSSTEAPSITTQLPAASEAAVTGFLDLRPTVDLSSATKDARLETSVGLGYKFTKDVSITAEQPFWSNINGAAGAGLNGTIAREGHVRLDVRNIAKSGAFSFGYQARAYYPSRGAWRDNGFITQIRNAFYVTAQVTPAFSVTLFEVPIVHVFDKANGPGGYNPSFENRIVLAPELSLLGGKLSIGCPIFFHQIKNREGLAGQKAVAGFTGGADQWWFSIWISPEVMYNVTKEVQLGLSFDSADFITPDFSKATIGDAFANGAPKVAFRMTL